MPPNLPRDAVPLTDRNNNAPLRGSGGAGRFAPSPTGNLHVGNLRTATAAWAWARHLGNRFLLRVDDLDPDRSRPAFEAQQLQDLTDLGITWDAPPTHQSDRTLAYAQAIDTLKALDVVYRCFCTRAEIRAAASAPHGDSPAEEHYPGTCAQLTAQSRRDRIAGGDAYALRVRASSTRIHAFDDLFLGEISGLVDDFVIARKDGVAAYNLATVVDDTASDISLVVRGADLAATTHRQIWLAEMLGYHTPHYAHVPLVLNPRGERLSKRDGAISLTDLASCGASVNQVREWIMHSLGSPQGTHCDDFVHPENWFSPDHIPTAPAVWTGP